MVLMAVLAAVAVTPVLLLAVKRAGAPISTAVALAMVAVAVAIPAVLAESGALPAGWLPVPWVVAVLGVPLALTDLRYHRLPDVLTGPAYPAVVIALTLAALDEGPHLLLAALTGCFLFGGAHLLVHRVSPGALGAGDVKLSGALGAVLGALGGPAPPAAAALAAAVSATGLAAAHLRRRFHRPRAVSSPTPTTSPTSTTSSTPPTPAALPTPPAPPIPPTVPSTPPAHRRLHRPRPRLRPRDGPPRLLVPHGPGLMLATWFCAVFPFPGSGVA